MAFTAREVIMTFRGQNYLSGAIRRVGRDVGTLSRATTLSNQRAAATIASQRVRNTIRLAEAEKASLVYGARRQALDLQRSRLANQEQDHLQSIRRNQEAITLNAKNQLDAEIRAAQLARAKPGTRVPGYGVLTKKELGKAVEAQKLAQDRLIEQQITLERQSEILNAKTATQSAAVQQLSARYIALGERQGQLNDIIHTRNAALEEAVLRERMLAFEEEKILPVQKWRDRSASVEHFGRVLQMVGLIGTAALGAAAHAAANLSTQVTLAATQARPVNMGAAATARIRDNLQKQVMGLMRNLPFQGSEFADAFYQIFSGTKIQNPDKAANLIKNIGQAAVATSTDLKTMTDVGITMQNVFGNEFRGPHGPERAMNAFVAAVRYGRMNAAQFANSLPNVASIAKRVGLSFYDIAGAVAALTRQTGGRFTNRDTTGIARMIEIFARPDFVAGAKKMGVNIKDLHGNMRPLMDILTEFADKTRGTGGVDAINLFKTITGKGSASGTGGTQGTIQARRAFSFLINDIEKYRSVNKLVRQDNNELAESFKIMSKSPGVQWALFTNQLKVLIYTLGSQLIPVFLKLFQPISRFARWFSDLSDGAQHFIAMSLAIVSVGALLGGTFVSVAGAIAKMVFQFTLWRRMRVLETMVQTANATNIASVAGGVGGMGVINPATGAAFGASEGAAAAKTGFLAGMLARLGGTAGEANVALIGLLATVVVAGGLMYKFHNQIIGLVDSGKDLKQLFEAFAVGAAVFALIKYSTVITAMVKGMRALVVAIRAAAVAEGFLAGATVAAEAAMGGLLASITAIFSLPVLAGLAAVAAALLLIKARSKIPGQIDQNVSGALIRTQQGNYQKLLIGRGAQVRVNLTPKEAAEQYPDSIPARLRARHRAIIQEIADSPRYTHAIGANQKAVDAYNKSLDAMARKAFQNRVNQQIPIVQRQPGLMAQIAHLRQLQQQAGAATSTQDMYQRITKFGAALANVLKGKTKAQQEAIRQILKASAVSPAVMNRSVSQDINAVVAAQKAVIAHPTSIKAQMALAKAENDLNQKYKDRPNLLAAINAVIGNYVQNLNQAANSTNKLGITFQDVFSGIQNMYNNFKSQEENIFGTLFQGPFVNSGRMQNILQFGGRLTGADLLHDLRSQGARLRQFHGAIDSLTRKGAPNALIEQLMQAGPEALPQIQALNKMSPKLFNQYTSSFRESQKLIEKYTMSDLQRQLKVYRAHGRNIALAIIAGLRDENVNMTNALTKMIRKMFPGLPVGATGAGGKPTHTAPTKTPPPTVVVVGGDQNGISKKNAARHENLAKRNRYSRGGPAIPR